MATWVQAPHHAPSPIGQSHLLCVQAALDPQLPLVRLQVAPSELIRPPARPATAPLRLPVALEPPELLGHLQGAPARQAFMARSHQSPGRLQVREHLTQSLRMLSNEPQLHYSSQQQKRLLVVAAPQRCRQPYPDGPMDPGFDPSLAPSCTVAADRAAGRSCPWHVMASASFNSSGGRQGPRHAPFAHGQRPQTGRESGVRA